MRAVTAPRSDGTFSDVTRRLFSAGLFVAGAAALAWTWQFLFVWFAGMTEGWLAPWDVAPGRPPHGTWARAANDFFEVPGALLPSRAFVAADAGLFATTLVRAQRRAGVPLAFAASNVTFLLLDMALVLFVAHPMGAALSGAIGPGDMAGYHRAWPAIVVTLALLVALFAVQSRCSFRRGSSWRTR